MAFKRGRKGAPKGKAAEKDVDEEQFEGDDEEPEIEAPEIEEPVVEEPVVEEPVVEETVVEEPVVEDPVVEDPVVEDPVVEEPVVEEPVIEDSINEVPEEPKEGIIKAEEVAAVEPSEGVEKQDTTAEASAADNEDEPEAKKPRLDEDGAQEGEGEVKDAIAERVDSEVGAADAVGSLGKPGPPPFERKKKYIPPIPCSAGLGVQLNPSNSNHFDHFLFQLMLFKSETNGYHVPKDDYPELYTWLQAVKRMYKQQMLASSNLKEQGSLAKGMPLTIAQVKVLESLHIPLTSRGDDHWNRFFGLLKAYKSRHGHALVPRLCEVPGLGDWVTDQRRQYKAWKQGLPTQLTKDRREKLSALGFAWQVRNRPEWDVRFAELVDYKKKHGDCKVPQHYKDNKALGKWVAKQREQFKLYNKGEHSFLTPYRLEKLDAIGFVWQIRNSLDGGVDFEDEIKKPGPKKRGPKPKREHENREEVEDEDAAPTEEEVAATMDAEAEAAVNMDAEAEAAAAEAAMLVEENPTITV